MRFGLAAKILVPFAVFMLMVAVLGDLFVVTLGNQVAAIPGATVQTAAAARTLTLTYVLVSLLLVVLLLAIYMLIVRGLTRRLAALRALTEQVEADSFPAMVQVEGNDELAALTRAFVAMNTRLERSYRKLDEAQKQAARHEKLASLGKLASSVAHEINNPNGIISLYAQIAVRRPGLEPELARELATIQRESERITKIVRELLDYARPTPLQHETCDLAALLRETVAQTLPLLGEVTVTVHGAETPLPVHGDPGRLRQVMVNLLTNARDAAGEGGVITVGAAGENGGVVLRVADSGPGLPPGVRERIFEPFFTTKEKGKGSGLGLAICHRIIVEEHGGLIEADNGRQGAVFTVTLPAAAGTERERGARNHTGA